MKTNTIFLLGGLALAVFAISRKKANTTGTAAAPGNTTNTAPNNTSAVPTVNPNANTQEQQQAQEQQWFMTSYNPNINNAFGNANWGQFNFQGGQPGGGGLLPF